jgi:hypothetical protein
MKLSTKFGLKILFFCALATLAVIATHLLRASAESSVRQLRPNDEAGWFTIASKPAWNQKAGMWEMACYLGNDETDGPSSKKVVVFCSPLQNVGNKIAYLSKGDKAYLVYPLIHGTGVYLVNNLKTALEYTNDVVRIGLR